MEDGMRIAGFAGMALVALFAVAACEKGTDVRAISITISEAGCAPSSAEVEPGRTVQLRVKNKSAQLYRVTDDAERIEPLGVEPGKEAEAFYDVPLGAGSYPLRCMAADGTASTLTLDASAGAAAAENATPGGEAGTPAPGAPDATLAVTLIEYSVTPSQAEIGPGRISLIATNISQAMAHELNVMRLQPDGSFADVGKIDPIDPQRGGSMIVNLQPGTYRLACRIGIGQSGSTVDHYQQGMWTDITVR